MLTHARAFLFLCIHLLLLFLVTAEQAQPPLTMSFTTPTHGFHLLETRASSTGGQLLATTKAAVPPLLILKDGTLVCPRGPDEQRLLAHLQSILAEKHTNDARQPTVAATVRLLEALIQQSSLLPSPKKNDDSPFDLQQLLHISPSLVTSIDAGGIATACQDFHAHPRLISSAATLVPALKSLLSRCKIAEAESLLVKSFREAVNRDCLSGGSIICYSVEWSSGDVRRKVVEGRKD